MPDSGTNSCSWSEVTEDSHPLDVELPFPVIGAPVASQNAVSSHMDQNRPSVDSYAARVRHNLPEDVEPVTPPPPLRRRADYLSAFRRVQCNP